MVTIAKQNYSVARVKAYTTDGIGKIERHNERKNESYQNMNVVFDRVSLNVHFKDPDTRTYNDTLKELLADGVVSRRGLKADAKVFDEMLVDVNTQYFEEHGGYDYAVRFYEQAYRFAVSEYGEDNIVSAVMHADELNKAMSEHYGYPVYHYQIKKDTERLGELQAKIEAEQIVYAAVHPEHKTFAEIDSMGKKGITGKYAVAKEDYEALTSLAKVGISSRGKIRDLSNENSRLRSRVWELQAQIERLHERIRKMEEFCRPYLEAMKRFPEKAKAFFTELLKPKEQQIQEEWNIQIQPKKRKSEDIER